VLPDLGPTPNQLPIGIWFHVLQVNGLKPTNKRTSCGLTTIYHNWDSQQQVEKQDEQDKLAGSWPFGVFNWGMVASGRPRRPSPMLAGSWLSHPWRLTIWQSNKMTVYNDADHVKSRIGFIRFHGSLIYLDDFGCQLGLPVVGFIRWPNWRPAEVASAWPALWWTAPRWERKRRRTGRLWRRLLGVWKWDEMRAGQVSVGSWMVWIGRKLKTDETGNGVPSFPHSYMLVNETSSAKLQLKCSPLIRLVTARKDGFVWNVGF